MKESTAQKLGVILAYTNQAIETINTSQASFEELMSIESIQESISRLQTLKVSITELVDKSSLTQVSALGESSTTEKLKSLKSAYMQGNSDDKQSVFEWWSFFGGASIAQWNMVKGLAESVETDSFAGIAYEGIAIHESLFNNICVELTEAGRQAAK
jgi:hypothetical protein